MLKRKEYFLRELIKTIYSQIYTDKKYNNIAKSVLLKNKNTEEVIYEFNATKAFSVGSIVKLMTSLIVLENYDINDHFNIKYHLNGFNDPNSIYANVGLKEGEKISIQNLLTQTLVASACDASYALSGNSEKEKSKFILQMNNYAKKLQMKNSYFNDSVGYSNKNTMSSKDIFILTKTLLTKYKKEMPLILKDNFTYNGNTFSTTLPNFKTNDDTIIIKGIKTGYLKSAGRSIVIYIKDKDLNEYILIIVGAKRMIYRDLIIENILKKYLNITTHVII